MNRSDLNYSNVPRAKKRTPDPRDAKVFSSMCFAESARLAGGPLLDLGTYPVSFLTEILAFPNASPVSGNWIPVASTASLIVLRWRFRRWKEQVRPLRLATYRGVESPELGLDLYAMPSKRAVRGAYARGGVDPICPNYL
jgi:hypothetical protein